MDLHWCDFFVEFSASDVWRSNKKLIVGCMGRWWFLIQFTLVDCSYTHTHRMIHYPGMLDFLLAEDQQTSKLWKMTCGQLCGNNSTKSIYPFFSENSIKPNSPTQQCWYVQKYGDVCQSVTINTWIYKAFLRLPRCTMMRGSMTLDDVFGVNIDIQCGAP